MTKPNSPTEIVSGILAYLESIGQTTALPEIVKLLGQQVAQNKDEVRVESAITLSQPEKAAIQDWVQANIGSRIINYRLDPRVIGGFRLFIGDQCIDLSVARKRNQIYAE